MTRPALYEQTIVEYRVSPCPPDHRSAASWVISVVPHGGGWLIRWFGELLDASGKWTGEQEIPHAAVPRWVHADLDAALALARAAAPGLVLNGRTFTEWEAHWAAREARG